MTKATHRYDESFTIPADATAEDVQRLLTKALVAFEKQEADIDWANLEISSERHLEWDYGTIVIPLDVVSREYTTVTLTARGRK